MTSLVTITAVCLDKESKGDYFKLQCKVDSDMKILPSQMKGYFFDEGSPYGVQVDPGGDVDYRGKDFGCETVLKLVGKQAVEGEYITRTDSYGDVLWGNYQYHITGVAGCS